MVPRTIVMDNGGDTCKVGFGGQAKPIKLVQNSIVRLKNNTTHTYIGHHQDHIVDQSGLYYRRPHERGYVTDWSVQAQIWSQVFGPSLLNIQPTDCTLLLTEPLFNPAPLRQEQDEVVMETFGFLSYHRTSASALALRGYQYEIQSLYGKPCALVVDVGYSWTTITPIYNYVPVAAAVRRIDVGGKVMSNWLKELVSYRHINMYDDLYLINDMKEKLCHVSQDITADLRLAAKHKKLNHLTRQYLLPNHITTHTGTVLSSTADGTGTAATTTTTTGGDDVVISVSNECIAVPELLFYPSDVGIDQGGLGAAIVESVSACAEYMHALLYEHIIVLGGSSQFPGLIERLESEIRQRAPDEYRVRIRRSSEPLTTAWCGGSCLSIDPSFPNVSVTKREYDEWGHSIFLQKFGG